MTVGNFLISPNNSFSILSTVESLDFPELSGIRTIALFQERSISVGLDQSAVEIFEGEVKVVFELFVPFISSSLEHTKLGQNIIRFIIINQIYGHSVLSYIKS